MPYSECGLVLFQWVVSRFFPEALEEAFLLLLLGWFDISCGRKKERKLWWMNDHHLIIYNAGFNKSISDEEVSVLKQFRVLVWNFFVEMFFWVYGSKFYNFSKPSKSVIEIKFHKPTPMIVTLTHKFAVCSRPKIYFWYVTNGSDQRIWTSEIEKAKGWLVNDVWGKSRIQCAIRTTTMISNCHKKKD